jgi:hypothetical protein
MANDTELLSLNSELRLVDVRLSELTNRVDTGESGELWTSMKLTYAKLVAAFREKDADAISNNLRELNTLINHGEGDYKAWEQIADLVEQRRKLTESEQKRIISAGHMLRMDEAQRLMGALTASVRKHVNDTATLERINAEFIRLSERSDKSGTLAGQDDSE